MAVAAFDGNDLRVVLEQPLPTTLEEQDAFQIFVGSLIQSVDTTIVLGVKDPIQTGLNDIVVFGPPDLKVIPGVANDAALIFIVEGIVDAFKETPKGAFPVFDAPESTAKVTYFRHNRASGPHPCQKQCAWVNQHNVTLPDRDVFLWR